MKWVSRLVLFFILAFFCNEVVYAETLIDEGNLFNQVEIENDSKQDEGKENKQERIGPQSSSKTLKWHTPFGLDPVSGLLKYGVGESIYENGYGTPSVSLSVNQNTKDIYFVRTSNMKNENFLKMGMGQGLHLLRGDGYRQDISRADILYGEVTFKQAKKESIKDPTFDVMYDKISAFSDSKDGWGLGNSDNDKTDLDLSTRLEMEPDLVNSGIRHTYYIRNNAPYTKEVPIFVAYDSEVNGNKLISVRSLGVNKGMYIEASGYRIEYHTDVANGPLYYNVSHSLGGAIATLGGVFGLDDRGENVKIFANHQPYGTELVNIATMRSTAVFMYWGRRQIKPNEEIVISYDIRLQPTNSYVKVHHNYEDNTTVSPPKTLVGTIGSSYTAKSLIPERTDLILVKTVGNPQGSFADAPQEVTFVYRKKALGKVTVKHTYQSGQQVIADQSLSGLEGTPYSTAPLSGPAFNGMSGSQNGTFRSTPQTVSYYYSNLAAVSLGVTDKNNSNKHNQTISEGELLKYKISVKGQANDKFGQGTKIELPVDNKLTIKDVNKLKFTLERTGKSIGTVTYDEKKRVIVATVQSADVGALASKDTLVVDYEATVNEGKVGQILTGQGNAFVRLPGGYSQDQLLSNEVKTTINAKPIVKKDLTVKFVNELGQPLENNAYTFTKKDQLVGSTVNLKTDSPFQKHLADIVALGYKVKEKPINEETILIDAGNNTVTYKMEGVVFLKSAPQSFDFDSIEYDGKKKRVNSPKIVNSLIVNDMRGNKASGWTLYAKVVKPLTNTAEATQTLKNAIHYVAKGKEVILGIANQPIYQKQGGGTQNVSSSWGTNEKDDGMKLEVDPSLNPIYTGQYEGEIVWQIVPGIP